MTAMAKTTYHAKDPTTKIGGTDFAGAPVTLDFTKGDLMFDDDDQTHGQTLAHALEAGHITIVKSKAKE
jgi:hypothetical protein